VEARVIKLQAPDATQNSERFDEVPVTGVAEDTTILVRFSEPMDRASMKNAYESPDIKGVTFAYSDDDTTVTITPDVLLEYAAGDVPNVYTVIMNTTAQDKAGNRLASAD
jgi:hypothetical protein